MKKSAGRFHLAVKRVRGVVHALDASIHGTGGICIRSSVKERCGRIQSLVCAVKVISRDVKIGKWRWRPEGRRLKFQKPSLGGFVCAYQKPSYAARQGDAILACQGAWHRNRVDDKRMVSKALGICLRWHKRDTAGRRVNRIAAGECGRTESGGIVFVLRAADGTHTV